MKAADTRTAAIQAKNNISFFSKEKGQGFFNTKSTEPFFSKRSNDHPAIQTKLTIGQPNDKYEQEADAMADKVVQRLACPEPFAKKETSIQSKPIAGNITPLIQAKCADCEKEELQKKEEEDVVQESPLGLQKKPIFESNAEPPDDENTIQRKCAECEKEEQLQKKSDSSTETTASTAIENKLSSSKGSGSPIPADTKAQMENSFGTNFSDVRLHTDSSSVQMNKDLQAQAFTHGSDIYFNSGKLDANTNSGKHLLAHELTHVVQQSCLPINAEPSFEDNAKQSQRSNDTIPEVQLLGNLREVPADLGCKPADTSPGSSGTSIFFGPNSSELTSASNSILSSIAFAWHAGGETGVLRIDGYASVEGGDRSNWRLSCKRALAVASELEVPSDGSPGVPNTNIEFFAQGETDEFSTSTLAPNRRAVITTTGGAPAPGPACGLTVTGPDEVDHYCAAYVPSDAPSCGIFPAPNITLSVTGVGAGRIPFWSIVRGGNRASLVGPVGAASVNIKGDAPSISQGDVTVQVTDGSCTTIHRITVREPTTMPASTVASRGPSFVQILVTYTVLDQFGNPMGANICWDETVTTCADTHPGGSHAKGDIGTNASGQVVDRLNVSVASGSLPSGMCKKYNQIITVGGCGPLAQNTIVFQTTGASLNQGSSCVSGNPCP